MSESNTATIDLGTDSDALPARPRRMGFGRAAMALSAVLIAALGFIGGVQAQKHQGGGATAAAAAPAAGTARGGFGGPPGAGGDVTVGTVASKKGRYLYVKDADGNLVRVKATSHSTINRTAKAKTSAVHPGDSVVVQGAKSSNGTVTATRITASAAGASAFGGGGGGGGGFGGRQAQATGG